MMFNTYSGYILFNMFLVILAFGESSLVLQWGFLELSTVSAIPLLVGSGVFHSAQAGVKYFISQAPVSVWLLTSLMFVNSSFMHDLFYLVLIFKLGLPPCHGWLFSLMDFLGLKELCLLLTLQKMLPTYLMESNEGGSMLYISMICTTLLMLMALFVVSSLKPVLLLTSMSGAFWPIMSILESVLWLEFFFIYSFFIIMLCFHLSGLNVTEFSGMIEKPHMARLTLCMQFFNLGGLPPFSGFFLKLFVMKFLIMESVWVVVCLLILSFLTLYLFMQLCIPLLLSTPSVSSNEQKTHNFWHLFAVLPVIPLTFYF